MDCARLTSDKIAFVPPRECLRMTGKFDPAPLDKHAADPREALNADFMADEQLKAGIVGGSFPASDPPSATQPSPSKYDVGTEC